MITIEVIKNKIFTDKRFWGKRYTNNLGEQILNILFYLNKDGKSDYILLINGKDETADFKKQVKEKYKNIRNIELRDSFYKYTKVN